MTSKRELTPQEPLQPALNTDAVRFSVVQTSDEVDGPEPLCLIRFRPSWNSL